MPRAWLMLEALVQQWRELGERVYPASLAPEAVRVLDGLDRRIELLIASGDPAVAELEDDIRSRLPADFDLTITIAPGLEYYPLKNAAVAVATGDVLVFIDSDVIPDPGWMAHLLGSFGRPDIDVVCAQTYVRPVDTYSRAFAAGWTYAPRHNEGRIFQPKKFYANTIAFRQEVFHKVGGFPALGCKTRGAASLLGQALGEIGVGVWENENAAVDHPPPSSYRHLAVRAIAHGRDQYMKHDEHRHIGGLVNSVGLAAGRLGRGCYRTLRYAGEIGLQPWAIPAALAITSTYYGFFALGGVLTHLSPEMMGRRFRV
ncbi:MAG: glycosyltransferase [Candidatus Binatia bacterium]